MMIRIEEISPLLCGEIVCVINGEKRTFKCGAELEKAELKNHIVVSISVQDGKLVLELASWQIPIADTDSAWFKEYEKQNGTEPSFF